MKNDELKPPTTICPECFKTKREKVKAGIFCYCSHGQAAAFLPSHSDMPGSWIVISPTPLEGYKIWKSGIATGAIVSDPPAAETKNTVTHD